MTSSLSKLLAEPIKDIAYGMQWMSAPDACQSDFAVPRISCGLHPNLSLFPIIPLPRGFGRNIALIVKFFQID